MRNLFSVYPLLLLAGIWLPVPALAEDDSPRTEQAEAAASPWPVKFTQAGTAYIVYPPRFDAWEDDRLRGQAAVSVQPEGEDRPNFGTVSISASTKDAGDGRIDISGLEIGDANFPAAAERSAEYLRVLRDKLSTKSWQTAAHRLQNDFAIERTAQQTRSVPVRNDPPRILFSQQPAVLVPIDGDPVMREVDQSRLLRVVNTRALLLFDKANGRYYLHAAGHWLSARSLGGPWEETREIADELERAKQAAVQQGKADLLERDGEPSAAQAPVIHVSTAPTELLQTDGPVEYTPIPDTQLLYVSNSPDKIFFDMRSQRFLVLLAGRWYRATQLGNGQWEHVPGDELPQDFARIPADHPTAVVQSAVPGTPQAEEAVIANSVPQVATIRRDAARIELSYDGEPDFRPIEGTSLHYAVNAPVPVIRVSPDSYYALDNGVWFTARSPYGTWSVASHVPAAIYGIPRSSPLHYVTYVRVYGETAETVDYGYTPGYVGSYTSNNVVVFGTGWYHSPWVGYYWYGSPYTWGYGFNVHYSWWYPWYPYYPYPYWYPAYWRPYPCYRPWWGPWVPPAHATPVRAAPRPHPIRGMITEQYPSSSPASMGGSVYQRWGREVARQVAPPPARVAQSQRLQPGTGYIIRDGRRYDFSDRALDRQLGTVLPGIPGRRAVPDGAIGSNAGRVFERAQPSVNTPRGRAVAPQAQSGVTAPGSVGRNTEQVFRNRAFESRDLSPRARLGNEASARPGIRTLPERRSAPNIAPPAVTNQGGTISRSLRSMLPPASGTVTQPPAMLQQRPIPQSSPRLLPAPQSRPTPAPQSSPRLMPAPQPRVMPAPQSQAPRAVPQRAQPQRQPSGGAAIHQGVQRAFGNR
jgi:hypothetical protein